MKQNNLKEIIILLIGTMIVVFAISNIHSRYKIAEGTIRNRIATI